MSNEKPKHPIKLALRFTQETDTPLKFASAHHVPEIAAQEPSFRMKRSKERTVTCGHCQIRGCSVLRQMQADFSSQSVVGKRQLVL